MVKAEQGVELRTVQQRPAPVKGELVVQAAPLKGEIVVDASPPKGEIVVSAATPRAERAEPAERPEPAGDLPEPFEFATCRTPGRNQGGGTGERGGRMFRELE